MDYFSFASTITSIVLSVVAIIMTISSESKSESVKHQIDKSVDELECSTQAIKEYTMRMNTQAESQEKIFLEILNKSEEILNMTKSLDKRLESKSFEKQTLSLDVQPAQFEEEDIHL